MGQKVAGTCYIKVDGEQLVITGGVEVPLSKVKRETVVPGYFKEEDRAPFTKVDAVMTPDFPITKLVNGTNMTVTTEFKTGRSYVLSGGYLVDEVNVTGDDGKVSLNFDGIAGDWQ